MELRACASRPHVPFSGSQCAARFQYTTIHKLSKSLQSARALHAVPGPQASTAPASTVEQAARTALAQPASPTNGTGSASSTALCKQDFTKFVQFFRQAYPYIDGHRGRTFVIVIPSQVLEDQSLLQSVLADVGLLHGLGVRLVLVLGAQTLIDAELRQRGLDPRYVVGYRVTDAPSLDAAILASGKTRATVERYLSKGPSVPMLRRHAKSDTEMHHGPAICVVSGNYVAARKRGIVDGVDFGYTGEVRFVLKDDMRRQLEDSNVILLNNLGYSATGELLNCNVYDIGLHAAVELEADKLFVVHLDDVSDLSLPAWLPVNKAKEMLQRRLDEQPPPPAAPSSYPSVPRVVDPLVVNLDMWAGHGFPASVSACVVACSKGVKRAHLLDARIDGGLLLELYSRDGVGTMISADFYEGIRPARATDLDDVMVLLAPLEAAGVLVKRSREEMSNLMPAFTVLERETKVMGCALLLPLGVSDDGSSVAEVGAFCVDPSFRGSGRGDSLLDYVEQQARLKGIRRLVLLTTRTADWFTQRDFVLAGPAWCSPLLPATRREKVNPARNSQLYVKDLEAPDASTAAPGERIGF